LDLSVIYGWDCTFIGAHRKKKMTIARRRRSPATVFGELGSGRTLDGERRSTEITVAIGGWRQTAAMNSGEQFTPP
jgi:hypothetical protein